MNPLHQISLSLCAPLPGGPREPLWPTGRLPPLFVVGPACHAKNPQPPRPCPVSATGCRRRFWPPRCTKNLQTGRLGLPHPSLATGLPLELIARHRHAMAACVAGLPLRPSAVPRCRDAWRVGTLKIRYPRIQALSQDNEQGVHPRAAM
jgi:hypothetical protein